MGDEVDWDTKTHSLDHGGCLGDDDAILGRAAPGLTIRLPAPIGSANGDVFAGPKNRLRSFRDNG